MYVQGIDNWLVDSVLIGSAYKITIDRVRTYFRFSYFQVLSLIMIQVIWICFLIHNNACQLHFLLFWWHSIASLTDGIDCARKD